MPPLVVADLAPVPQKLSSKSQQFWIEFFLGFVVVAAAAAEWWHQDQLTILQHLAVWCAFLLALTVLSRKGLVKLFGPVLFYDAIRTGRRKRYIILRCLYATAFLFVLYWTYSSQPRPFPGAWPRGFVRQADAAALAASFFYSFMQVQFLALIVFTPAYSAGAIAEEKERKTMEFLLATDLSSREIVLSKLVSQLGSLALLVMTGLPILGFLQFMGGVDPNLVLAGFVLTGLSMASLASVCILTSVYAKKPRTAIVVSYLIVFAYLALASWTNSKLAPAGFLTDAFNTGNMFALVTTLQADVDAGKNLAVTVPQLVRDYAFFHIGLAAVCSVWAVARVRSIALGQITATARQMRARAGFAVRPRVGRLPVIWKEIFVEPGLRLNWIAWLVLVMLFFLSLYLFVGTGSEFFDSLLGRGGYGNFSNIALNRWLYLKEVLTGERFDTIRPMLRPGVASVTPKPTYLTLAARWDLLSQLLNPWVRVTGTIVASLMLVGVAVRAAGSISGERERQTLDGLLTSPLQSHDLLFGKWLGSLLGVRRAWYWLGLIWGIGLVTGGLHPAALMLAFVAWLVYASCLAGVGLWFSISCRTSLRATLCTLAATLAASIGHWLIWLCLVIAFSSFGPMDYALGALHVSITPPAILYWLSASGLEMTWSNDWEVHACLGGFGLFVWALAACVIWSVSRRRFRKLTSRMPYRRPQLLDPYRQRADGSFKPDRLA
jgi:ABC-type transport system involved in multi-copper enzyme maturation permease subunit